MRKTLSCNAAIFAATAILTSTGSTVARAAGVQAELRSAAAILPNPIPGAVAPTAPAGGAVAGGQPWVCDAAKGFAPVVAVEQGVADPSLAVWGPPAPRRLRARRELRRIATWPRFLAVRP
jgi:hypothetical protein